MCQEQTDTVCDIQIWTVQEIWWLKKASVDWIDLVAARVVFLKAVRKIQQSFSAL